RENHSRMRWVRAKRPFEAKEAGSIVKGSLTYASSIFSLGFAALIFGCLSVELTREDDGPTARPLQAAAHLFGNFSDKDFKKEEFAHFVIYYHDEAFMHSPLKSAEDALNFDLDF